MFERTFYRVVRDSIIVRDSRRADSAVPRYSPPPWIHDRSRLDVNWSIHLRASLRR